MTDTRGTLRGALFVWGASSRSGQSITSYTGTRQQDPGQRGGTWIKTARGQQYNTDRDGVRALVRNCTLFVIICTGRASSTGKSITETDGRGRAARAADGRAQEAGEHMREKGTGVPTRTERGHTDGSKGTPCATDPTGHPRQGTPCNFSGERTPTAPTTF